MCRRVVFAQFSTYGTVCQVKFGLSRRIFHGIKLPLILIILAGWKDRGRLFIVDHREDVFVDWIFHRLLDRRRSDWKPGESIFLKCVFSFSVMEFISNHVHFLWSIYSYGNHLSFQYLQAETPGADDALSKTSTEKPSSSIESSADSLAAVGASEKTVSIPFLLAFLCWNFLCML